jgi:CRP/FNR family transcriptional regulator, cyclic AMP receptor protein
MDETRLRSIPLFTGLSRKELALVGRLADEVEVDAGRFLVREGEFAYEFFAIESGAAEVRQGDERVAGLGPGDFFGEMGLVGNARRSATVVATEPMRAVVMTGVAFKSMAREMPVVCDRIRDAIAERGRALQPSQAARSRT